MGQRSLRLPEPSTERSLILFAGGRATRLSGANKALQLVGGRTIVRRILDELGPLVEEQVALAGASVLEPETDLRLVPDAEPHAGVLPALAQGLAACRGTLCLAVACDMPFASAAVFQRLLDVQAEQDADVVVPRSGTYLEPMHAVYRREPVLRAIRDALARGEKRMIGYFPAVRVVEVDASEMEALSPAGVSPFFNVNTPADLAEAQRLSAGRP